MHFFNDLTPEGGKDWIRRLRIDMKKLLFVSILLGASQAHATYFFLESCEYKWVPEYGKSMYVGTYKSQYGNYFTAMFDTYCPQTINQ